MTFEAPLALLLLLAVPALVALWLWQDRRRHRAAAAFARPALHPNLVDRRPGRLRYLPLAVLLAGLAAMIFGVARPHAIVSEPREEATVLLAIDTSRSMGANDVTPTRLGAAVTAAKAFLDEVPKKFRVGVIAFGSRAVVSLPPTDDRTLVEKSLASLRTGEGTALGDAVLLGAQLGQKQRTSDGKVPPTAILLISDGARDGGRTTPKAAATRARQLHVPVYTVVVGTPQGEVRVPLPGGYTQVIQVPTSTATLQLVARLSGGRFFTAPNDERLRRVYEGLASRLGHVDKDRELSDVFSGGAAALVLGGAALSLGLFRRVIP
ncbi:MAG TPA: VWA domain-containing protein [Gaiellaceae bacterium]|nr:VWA domain-containing protein [Gaiellaceae bacterium]